MMSWSGFLFECLNAKTIGSILLNEAVQFHSEVALKRHLIRYKSHSNYLISPINQFINSPTAHVGCHNTWRCCKLKKLISTRFWLSLMRISRSWVSLPSGPRRNLSRLYRVILCSTPHLPTSQLPPPTSHHPPAAFHHPPSYRRMINIFLISFSLPLL